VLRFRNTRSPLLRSSSSEIPSSAFYYASSRPFKHRPLFPQSRFSIARLFPSHASLFVLRFPRTYLFCYRRFRFLCRVLSFPSALRAGLADGGSKASGFLKGEAGGTDTRGGGQNPSSPAPKTRYLKENAFPWRPGGAEHSETRAE
jgi:hypothetical protein